MAKSLALCSRYDNPTQYRPSLPSWHPDSIMDASAGNAPLSCLCWLPPQALWIRACLRQPRSQSSADPVSLLHMH